MLQDRDIRQDQDTTRDRDQDRDRDRDRVAADARMDDGSVMYGWQLMTTAEREAYRTRMRSLRTEREREALRVQHHQEMQQRARERGVQLGDMPARSGGR